MKPKTIIHTTRGTRIKSAQSFVQIRRQIYEAPVGQFVAFRKLMDHGAERDCALAVEQIEHVEAL
jgi:hypothetical protein